MKTYNTTLAIDMGRDYIKADRARESWAGYKIDRGAVRRMDAKRDMALLHFRRAVLALAGPELADVRAELPIWAVQDGAPAGMVL